MQAPEVLLDFDKIRAKLKGLNFDEATEVFKKELLELSERYELTPEYIFDSYIRWKYKSKPPSI